MALEIAICANYPETWDDLEDCQPVKLHKEQMRSCGV
jgi:hypothetical protein